MNAYMNDTGIRVSILAGIVVLIAAIIAPSWYIAALAAVWLIVTIIAIGKVNRTGGR
ncbi:hypothetical protein LRM64_19500 [Prescottella equi]|uniref:hypothetical protein n=1 Tax=Rhodococcus hoagii TaxID=43767 RepID=UPI0019ECB7B3|nr:hypothetical protein [Prescottella equi]MBM4580943.1 hypothetical protein [Prescottella equi]MBM4704426.1 hypothetical protein [Prescottella equi]MBM4707125.1 hypothetical protein [Prescottella equi]MCU7527385.1 hypothetical protein [Prescottella equi]MCU7535876.1 hypothetical protein [Prescottella equi]